MTAPNFTQILQALQNAVIAINNLQQTISHIFPNGLTSSASWTPGSISSGSQVSTTVTCSGAGLGMFAEASFSLNLQDLIISAYVNTSNSITVILANMTGGTVSIGAGTVKVWCHS